MSKYFGSWSNYAEMVESWKGYDSSYNKVKIINMPKPTEILFASYGGATYEGDAMVLFEQDGKLYEATGSHCSCNGLDGMWSPEKTTWEALGLRIPEIEKDLRSPNSYGFGPLSDHGTDARQAFVRLVKRNLKTLVSK